MAQSQESRDYGVKFKAYRGQSFAHKDVLGAAFDRLQAFLKGEDVSGECPIDAHYAQIEALKTASKDARAGYSLTKEEAQKIEVPEVGKEEVKEEPEPEVETEEEEKEDDNSSDWKEGMKKKFG